MASTATAVAKRDETDIAVGELPKEIQQALELRKLQNAVATKLAGMSWGQHLDFATRRAIAEYGRRYNIDVTTELDILGNRPYLNSRYYLRRLSEMIRSGVVEYAVADHVEDDPRLRALAEDPKAPPHVRESASAEIYRRAMMRVEFQAPEKAAAVVVFRVKLRGLTREVVGCKWAGNGVRKNDPVGDAHPVETAESRAARRAIRQIVSHVPAMAERLDEIEAAAEELEQAIGASAAETARQLIADPGSRDQRAHAATIAETLGEPEPGAIDPRELSTGDGEDPYQDDSDLAADELPLDVPARRDTRIAD